MRLGEVFHGGGKALHQGFYLLQPLPGILTMRGRERSFQFLRFAGLEPLQVGNGLLDLGSRSGQPDVAGGELNLAQVDMRGERVVGHPLRPAGAFAGLFDARFGDHLVRHHASRQQDADRAGQAQFVSDTVELEHGNDPNFPEADFPEDRTRKVTEQPARADSQQTGSLIRTG